MLDRLIVATTPRGIGLYNGSPCKKCGGTLRQNTDRNWCHACSLGRRAKAADNPATGPCRRCGEGDRDRMGRCKKCQRDATRRWKSTDRGQKSWRQKHLLKRYGITLEQFEAQLAAQGGVCAVCKRDKHLRQRNWHVDHDHETGAVRGILCATCNQGLGQFGDSVELLRSAIDYLLKAGGRANV